MSANFVGNTVIQSEAIKTYTPYDVTSSRPRKTTIAFFANFGGIVNMLKCGLIYMLKIEQGKVNRETKLVSVTCSGINPETLSGAWPCSFCTCVHAVPCCFL